MAIIPKSTNDQPRSTTSKLANSFEITIAGGMWCGWCGDDIVAADVEAMDDHGAMRLVCSCGRAVLIYEYL
jgi:hypothetical protein